jgi:transcriptional regulator with XRE-family HTH domain
MQTVVMDDGPTRGWHPDPSRPRGIRFWDGERWTAHSTDWPSEDEWNTAVTAPDWGEHVLAELRRYFAKGRPTLEPVRLIDASLDVDPDGVPVLLAIYEHAFWPERTGMRRRLDRTPVSGTPGDRSLAEWLVDDIAWLEMGEPLGRRHDLLVEDDNGVWWWGDGYPDMTQHPDYERLQREERAHLAQLRADDGEVLRTGRTAIGMSVDELAAASGVSVDKLKDAEGAEPQVNLTADDWLRLAVALEGHTWDESEAQQIRNALPELLSVPEHRKRHYGQREMARALARYYFSPDGPGSERT